MTRPKKKTPDPQQTLDFLNETSRSLDMTLFAGALLEVFGGPGGLAKEVKAVYTKSESAHAKSRMLETVVRVITNASGGLKTDIQDTKDMSETDMLDVLRVALGQDYEREEME